MEEAIVMKKIHFFVITILVLAVFLSGCAGGVTPSNDEIKVKSSINGYFSALNDQNWNKAKSYCTFGSEQYNETIQLENTVENYCFSYDDCRVVIAINPTILDTWFNGPYFCCVYCHMNDFSAFDGDYLNNTQSYIMYYHLEKVGNEWKLFEKHT